LTERVLIVGCGSIGSRHYAWVRKLLPNADIKVACRSSHNNLFDEELRPLLTIEECINYSPTLAIIANAASHHMQFAIPLAINGADIFVEKPISTSIPDTIKLIEICGNKKLKLGVGYNLRYLPSLLAFKSSIEQKIVGNIFSIRAEVGQYLPSWRKGSDYSKSVTAQKKLGGGALFELSHELDYMGWIFGLAQSLQGMYQKTSNLDIDVEDIVEVTMLIGSPLQNNSIIASIHLDLLRSDTTRSCTVIGEGGTLKWDGIKGVVNLHKRGESESRAIYMEDEAIENTYISELNDFLSSERPLLLQPLANGYDGLYVLRTIEAIRLSNLTGKRVILTKDFSG
jgi:predicted dehydrogenase